MVVRYKSITGAQRAKKYFPVSQIKLNAIVDECIMWCGGLHSSALCGYVYSICPCIQPAEFRMLLENINEIYKYFYNRDLIFNIEEVRCSCGDFCAGMKDDALIHNTNLDDNEIQLIKIVTQIFCKLGRKRKVTLDDLQNREFTIKGILPADFDFAALKEDAEYKYCRETLETNFYPSEKDFTEEETVAFYPGHNGVAVSEGSEVELNFYNETEGE